jgi:hypothetical protein
VALLVVEDLGVGQAGAVVQSGVQEPVADRGPPALRCPASAVDPPAAPVRDAGEFLDIDMDQLAGPVPLVSAHRLPVGGTVAPIEPAEPGPTQDRLHGRGGEPGLMGDVTSAPAVLGP